MNSLNIIYLDKRVEKKREDIKKFEILKICFSLCKNHNYKIKFFLNTFFINFFTYWE